MNKLTKGKIFYGWFIVAAGFIIMATGWGTVYNCASLFIKPISDELNFTRSQYGVTMTLRAACQMIISLFSGKIFANYNVKKLMMVSTIALIVSYFSFSLASTLAMFYILTIISSIAISLVCILPLSLIISNWFHEKRGFAIGIAFMGSGIGGMILNSLTGVWIVNYGWRIAFQFLALIMLLTITPCTFFILKLHPRDVGLSPYGKSANTNLIKEEEGKVTLPISNAFKTINFWTICLCSIIVNMSINTLVQTPSPHLNDIGYSITFSANILALSFGSLAIGKIVLGKLFDSFNVRIAATISFFCTLIGVTSLIFANYYIALGLFIISSGIGSAYNTLSSPIITQKLFKEYDYSSINGVLSAVASLGSVIGPIFTGYLYDVNQSYIPGFIIMAILTVLVIFIFNIFLTRKSTAQ